MNCTFCDMPVEAAHPHDGFTECVKALGEMTSLLVKRVNRAEHAIVEVKAAAEHAIADVKAAADFKAYDERVKAREPAVLRAVDARGPYTLVRNELLAQLQEDSRRYHEAALAREPAASVVLDYIAAIFEFAEAADMYVIVQRRQAEIILSASKAYGAGDCRIAESMTVSTEGLELFKSGVRELAKAHWAGLCETIDRQIRSIKG